MDFSLVVGNYYKEGYMSNALRQEQKVEELTIPTDILRAHKKETVTKHSGDPIDLRELDKKEFGENCYKGVIDIKKLDRFSEENETENKQRRNMVLALLATTALGVATTFAPDIYQYGVQLFEGVKAAISSGISPVLAVGAAVTSFAAGMLLKDKVIDGYNAAKDKLFDNSKLVAENVKNKVDNVKSRIEPKLNTVGSKIQNLNNKRQEFSFDDLCVSVNALKDRAINFVVRDRGTEGAISGSPSLIQKASEGLRNIWSKLKGNSVVIEELNKIQFAAKKTMEGEVVYLVKKEGVKELQSVSKKEYNAIVSAFKEKGAVVQDGLEFVSMKSKVTGRTPEINSAVKFVKGVKKDAKFLLEENVQIILRNGNQTQEISGNPKTEGPNLREQLQAALRTVAPMKFAVETEPKYFTGSRSPM